MLLFLCLQEPIGSKDNANSVRDLMETATDIARALFKGNQSALWAELTEDLNALGPPVKAVGA